MSIDKETTYINLDKERIAVKTLEVMHKDIKIPARAIPIGNGTLKLVPIDTYPHTLYGVPTPTGIEITDDLRSLAKEIITKRVVLSKYIRKGQDGYILQKRSVSNDEVEYFIGRGEPYGVVVAFLNDGDLKIGWSKRLEGEVTGFGERRPKEPLIFTKKDATNIAVMRGLVDSLTFRGSGVYTDSDEAVPKAIAIILWPFIQRVENYFKCIASNVSPTEREE